MKNNETRTYEIGYCIYKTVDGMEMFHEYYEIVKGTYEDMMARVAEIKAEGGFCIGAQDRTECENGGEPETVHPEINGGILDNLVDLGDNAQELGAYVVAYCNEEGIEEETAVFTFLSDAQEEADWLRGKYDGVMVCEYDDHGQRVEVA